MYGEIPAQRAFFALRGQMQESENTAKCEDACKAGKPFGASSRTNLLAVPVEHGSVEKTSLVS